MVSKAMLTCGVSAAVVSLATFLGAFTSGIFEDTAEIFQQINSGQKVSVESVVSESDLARLRGIASEVATIQEESK